MLRFYAIFQITLLTSRRYGLAAFKAIDYSNLSIERFFAKCVNNASEMTDTFSGLLCDFLF